MLRGSVSHNNMFQGPSNNKVAMDIVFVYNAYYIYTVQEQIVNTQNVRQPLMDLLGHCSKHQIMRIYLP